MKVLETPLAGALLIEPDVFEDDRGFFLESYSERTFTKIGITEKFVQDNHSYSKRGVLRGLHYQIEKPQGKLIRVISGEVVDAFVDLQKTSASFGRAHSVRLSGENRRLLWIPPGFAHGFYVLSDAAHVLYKATEFYFPELERTIVWNDADLNIQWGITGQPLLSSKDAAGRHLREAEVFQ
jgi:dTDP-4-dehydrorhamnose 3,5-epimerase